MGTAVQVRIYTTISEDNQEAAKREEHSVEQAIAAAFAEIRRLEAMMTTWRKESEISQINAAAGVRPVQVSKEVLSVIVRSLEFSKLSQGAFDISFDALFGLWKFDDDLTPVLPDKNLIKKRLPLINWRRIQVDRAAQTVFLLTSSMRINLGGIGKGFAVDAASRLLKERGYPNHIVQAGGDLMLAGDKGGQPWMSGVRDPRGPMDDYFAVCPVRDHAFSTAGDYERSFILAGKRYHHILDPRTGYPADRARSVTVYAKDATTADGLDDAVLILGAKEGLKLIESVPDAGAIIVDDKNQVHISKRLKTLVKITHPPTPGI